MITSRVAASALPDLGPTSRLAGVLARSSASKDAERLMLRHEVALWTGPTAPCSVPGADIFLAACACTDWSCLPRFSAGIAG